MVEYYPINTSDHQLFDSGTDTRTSLLIQGLSPLHVLSLDVICDSNIVGYNFRVLPFWNREKFKGSDKTVTINRQVSIVLNYMAMIQKCLSVVCISYHLLFKNLNHHTYHISHKYTLYIHVSVKHRFKNLNREVEKPTGMKWALYIKVVFKLHSVLNKYTQLK